MFAFDPFFRTLVKYWKKTTSEEVEMPSRPVKLHLPADVAIGST